MGGKKALLFPQQCFIYLGRRLPAKEHLWQPDQYSQDPGVDFQSHRLEVKQQFGCTGIHTHTMKKQYHTYSFRHSFKGFSHIHNGTLLFFQSEAPLLNTAFQVCEVSHSFKEICQLKSAVGSFRKQSSRGQLEVTVLH